MSAKSIGVTILSLSVLVGVRVFAGEDEVRQAFAALQKAMGMQQVIEMPAKMTSEDFAEYGRAGVPALLLHIGAVNPAKLAEARRTGVPVPAPHSPEWLPDLEPTLKAAIRAETVALLDLFSGR